MYRGEIGWTVLWHLSLPLSLIVEVMGVLSNLGMALVLSLWIQVHNPRICFHFWFENRHPGLSWRNEPRKTSRSGSLSSYFLTLPANSVIVMDILTITVIWILSLSVLLRRHRRQRSNLGLIERISITLRRGLRLNWSHWRSNISLWPCTVSRKFGVSSHS